VLILNSRFYAQPAECRGFEQAYLCRAMEELAGAKSGGLLGAASKPASPPTFGSMALAKGSPRAGAGALTLGGRGSGALLPGAGWDVPSSLDGTRTLVLPELALVRAYPGRWQLYARERDAEGRAGLGGWQLVDQRATRPDPKALSLFHMQIGYAMQRRAQLAAAGKASALPSGAVAGLQPAADGGADSAESPGGAPDKRSGPS
jgi:hypothetical protein